MALVRCGILALVLSYWFVSALLTVQSYVLLRGDAAMADLRDGGVLSPERASTLISSREAATAWFANAQADKELGIIAYFGYSKDAPRFGEDRQAQLRLAISHLEQGLQRKRVDTMNWLLLARAKAGVVDQAGSIDALFRSIEQGRHVPHLAIPRVNLGLRFWGGLNEEQRSKLRYQIEVANRHNGGLLLQSIVQHASPDQWKVDLLRDNPNLLRLLQALGPRLKSVR